MPLENYNEYHVCQKSYRLAFPERSYMLGIQGEAFVENIDTTNSVSINDDSSQRRNDSEQSFTPGEQEQEKRSLSSAAPAYVVSAIEALAASGVYDNIEHVSGASTSHKVGVYDNNQSIKFTCRIPS